MGGVVQLSDSAYRCASSGHNRYSVVCVERLARYGGLKFILSRGISRMLLIRLGFGLIGRHMRDFFWSMVAQNELTDFVPMWWSTGVGQ